ncbi:MAG: CPBP family intramembrane metalloprotease [Phycisphaerales bacterium]|nr:CPBP family intramembrane metalloprotease [Phycisphaerales bacterium]
MLTLIFAQLTGPTVVRESPAEKIAFILLAMAPLIVLYAWVHNWIQPGTFRDREAGLKRVESFSAAVWAVLTLVALVIPGLIQALILQSQPGTPTGMSGTIRQFHAVTLVQLLGFAVVVPMIVLVCQQLATGTWAPRLRELIPSPAHASVLPSTKPGFLKFSWHELFVGLGLSVLVTCVVLLVGKVSTSLYAFFTQQAPNALAHDTLNSLFSSTASHPGWVIPAVIACVVIGAPVSEELVYRGFLHSGVLKAVRSRWLAIFISSALFTAVHIPVAQVYALPMFFTLGVALGVVLEKRGNLWSCVGVHAGFNAFQLFLAAMIASPAGQVR